MDNYSDWKRRKVVSGSSCSGERKEDTVQPEIAKNSIAPIESSVNKVLSNSMLLGKILDYALHVDNNAVDHQTAISLRLVQKEWREVTTGLLRKSKVLPLIKLELTKENSVNRMASVEEKGKLLDQFLTSVVSSSNLKTCVQPFCLKIHPDFFRQENHDSLSNCLLTCGSSLVELELILPMNGGSMTCLFPPGIALPMLKKLAVQLTSTVITNLTSGEVPSPHNDNVTYLMHSLLIAAPNLVEFNLPLKSSLFPASFRNLYLPQTLTKLEFSCKTSGQDLELLVRNQLQNLNYLKLCVDTTPHPKELLFKILDNCRGSLRKLCILGVENIGPPRLCTLLKFPVMERLETFSNTSVHCELDQEHQLMERYLPKLKTLELSHQTAGMLRKWTRFSRMTSVTTLWINVVHNELSERWLGEVSNFDEELMRDIHLSFPNVTALNLVLSSNQTCGLKYLFMEMRQLSNLRITLVGIWPQMNSDFWDGLLSGAPLEYIATLRTCPSEFLETVKIENDRLPSVVRLRDLRIFSLKANFPATDPTRSLISDLAFRLVFFKMPSLKKLELHGHFQASDEMTQLWRDQGNVLIYTPSTV